MSNRTIADLDDEHPVLGQYFELVRKAVLKMSLFQVLNELMAEINADRDAHGKKQFDDVYDKATQTFPEIGSIVAHFAYYTPAYLPKSV